MRKNYVLLIVSNCVFFPCPNEAIFMGPEVYVIDPAKCTECIGHHDEPQCQVICPIDCIYPDPEWKETEDELMDKFRLLTADKKLPV